MKRNTFALFLPALVMAALFQCCKSGKQDVSVQEKSEPLSVSGVSEPFKESFTEMLNSYYALKDALTAGDSVKVNAAATTLKLSAENLKVNEIDGDTTGTIRETAQSFTGTITGSATALALESDLEAKRREFNMITDALWSLTRTVRYNAQKVYYLYCPMAFDNTGAYWLSASREVNNPYFGDKMKNCGEVADSLDYSRQ